MTYETEALALADIPAAMERRWESNPVAMMDGGPGSDPRDWYAERQLSGGYRLRVRPIVHGTCT